MLFSPAFCTRRRAVSRHFFAALASAALLLGRTPLATAQAPGRATLAGTAHDAAGQPVPFATFLLVPAADTARVLQGVTGDLAGHYAFAGVGPGTYRVRGQLLGYQSATSAALSVVAGQAPAAVPPLVLKAAARRLAEVTVTAERPFVEQLPDKTVVNVENSLVAAGGTALDVLEKAPGVVVDQQNNRLQLKGRDGVLVMLDGKQTYLSQTEVVNLLRNTPSQNVQRIELITNPSAKYDAAGSAGIINIELKRGIRTSVPALPAASRWAAATAATLRARPAWPSTTARAAGTPSATITSTTASAGASPTPAAAPVPATRSSPCATRTSASPKAPPTPTRWGPTTAWAPAPPWACSAAATSTTAAPRALATTASRAPPGSC